MNSLRHALSLLLVGLVLAGCEGANDAGSAVSDSRVRLNAQKSYAEIGDYVVHVNGMTTAGLTPEIASAYGIVRSETAGLVNIVVLRKTGEIGADMPVPAAIELNAANLTAQVKEIELKEIRDGASIYYVGVLPVDDRETVNFDLDIRPDGAGRTLSVRYTHEFYTR